MVLVMTEVADLEVQEQIKFVDASFTWPHPTDEGYFTTAVFVRTTENKKYLIYCPKATSSISIDETVRDSYTFWKEPKIPPIREVSLTQNLYKFNGVLFYIIELERDYRKEVKKADIEKLFDIKVVE